MATLPVLRDQTQHTTAPNSQSKLQDPLTKKLVHISAKGHSHKPPQDPIQPPPTCALDSAVYLQKPADNWQI
jgi:hypothetical protein